MATHKQLTVHNVVFIMAQACARLSTFQPVIIPHPFDAHQGQEVIRKIDPLPGAREFLDALRKETQVIIISDTFTQFANPLMDKLAWPTIMCNELIVGPDGIITGYRMRIHDSKVSTVKALQAMGYDTIAAGDSYNDVGMIKESKGGFLFRSTEGIKKENPDIPAIETYDELLAGIKSIMNE